MILDNSIAALVDVGQKPQTPEELPPCDGAFWSEAAAADVRRHYRTGDKEHGWRAWRRHLNKQKRSRPWQRFLAGTQHPLRWSLSAGELRQDSGQRLKWLIQTVCNHGPSRRTARRTAAAAHDFLNEFSAVDQHSNGLHFGSNGAAFCADGCAAAYRAIEALGWAVLLAVRAELFDGDLWWQIFSRLDAVVKRELPAPHAGLLEQQVLHAELPLVMAALFAEIRRPVDLQGRALANVLQSLNKALDPHGIPHRESVAGFPLLLASWLRCRLILRDGDGSGPAAVFDSQLKQAIITAARLARAEAWCSGSHDDDSAVSSLSWLGAISGDLPLEKPLRWLVRLAFGAGRGRNKKAVAELPMPAFHSESRQIAVLRPKWSDGSARLNVAYHGGATHLELALGRKRLFAGVWSFDLAADGRAMEPTGGWRDVCWVSDDDCDYLELEMPLAGGLRLQRQILLARKDEFLFLADALAGNRAQELAYRARLPLVDGVAASTAVETRELLFESGKRSAIVLPLALGEWRGDCRSGTLSVSDRALDLRQTVFGCASYAPLWFDFSRSRRDEPLTWRQLTVAEARENLPRDVAAGYRVQFGTRQWLIYRSLTHPANRSVLGMNLSTDFFLGRFGRDGETKTILEVE